MSYSSQKFSKILVEEIMRQYNNVSSGELKNLSTLLVEILVSLRYPVLNSSSEWGTVAEWSKALRLRERIRKNLKIPGSPLDQAIVKNFPCE